MRILFHIPTLEIGGAERQLTYLVKYLFQYGWEVHVVTLYSGGLFWDELDSFDGCKLHSLDRYSKWDFSVILKLRYYIEQHNIDVVQGWMMPCNIFAALAAKISRKPMFMAVRSSDVKYHLGGEIYAYTDKVAAKWFAEKVVFNSWAGYEYNQTKGYPTEKSLIIPNGLEGPSVDFFEIPFQHSPPWKIGLFARLDPLKDHVMMFEAVQLLVKKGAPVELFLYGDGKPDWKLHLEKEAERLGVYKYVHWEGFTDNVWNALSKMDIICSSSFSEGMSNTILEAMMAGRPIVATDVGDTKRMLNGNADRCGWTVPARDPSAMADTILSVIENPIDSVNLANRAKEIALSQYTVDAMASKFENIYMECLSGQ